MIFINRQNLVDFSWHHFNYINQIFGHESVRKLIQKYYPCETYKLIVIVDEKNQGGDHIVVYDKKNNHIINSYTEGWQNVEKNKNDNLCQSYSLLVYLNKRFKHMTHKEIQRRMICMYRQIIRNDNIMKEIMDNDDIIFKEYYGVDTNDELIDSGEICKNDICEQINYVLDDWEKFGYIHFQGNGEI